MARQKRVHRPDMVAHLWAHQSQGEARNAQGNFYFVGDTIYSYGTHFPIAKHVERKGRRAVLFTALDSSTTTSRHKRIVEMACSHLRVIRIYGNFSLAPREQFDCFIGRYKALAEKYTKARGRKPVILEEIRGLIEDANDYAEIFGLKSRLAAPDNIEDVIAECERVGRQEANRKQREKRRARREAEKRLQEWMNGGKALSYSFTLHNLPVRLRIVGDRVETSRGATVSLGGAKRVYKALKRLRDRGEEYRKNNTEPLGPRNAAEQPISFGSFAVDSFDANGTVKVGCHVIEWSEIERVAKLAGVS